MMKKRSIYFLITVLISGLYVNAGYAGEVESVQATRLNPLKPAAYVFHMAFDAPVSPTSQIEISFPKQFTLNQTVMAASGTMDGGFTVNVSDSSVLCRRTGKGASIPAGQSVDLKIATIINPVDMQTLYDLQIVLMNGTQTVEILEYRGTIEKLSQQ